MFQYIRLWQLSLISCVITCSSLEFHSYLWYLMVYMSWTQLKLATKIFFDNNQSGTMHNWLNCLLCSKLHNHVEAILYWLYNSFRRISQRSVCNNPVLNFKIDWLCQFKLCSSCIQFKGLCWIFSRTDRHIAPR